MLDFTELPKNGTDFELLLREYLFSQGMDVHWSGVGPDGGKDLICIERISSPFLESSRKWLVQCKHFAHSKRSVSTSDLDSIVDSCRQHGADGYILACSTFASAAVTERLSAIAADPANRLLACIIDGNMIERKLLTANYFQIAQRFFPVSSSASNWRVNFTESPNHFIVTFKGYLFHLFNRIGSKYEHHFSSISSRIEDFEAIPLPEGEFFRPRAFWYDDKNGGYVVALDLMVQHGHQATHNVPSLKRALGDQNVLGDGQYYSFDIMVRHYLPYSDHYDADHYDYYTPYLGSFLVGRGRERMPLPDEEWNIYYGDEEVVAQDGTLVDSAASGPFENMEKSLSAAFGLNFVRAENPCPEALRYIKNGSLRHLRDEHDISPSRISSALLVFRNAAREQVFTLIESLNVDLNCIVSCSEGLVFVPNDENKYERDFDDDRMLFVTLSAPFAQDAKEIRSNFSAMFLKISAQVSKT